MTERCAYQPENRDYAPCTREKGHNGPCAHPLVPGASVRESLESDTQIEPAITEAGDGTSRLGG